MRWARQLTVPLLVLMAGCASQVDRSYKEPDWLAHSDRLEQLANWDIDGRVAIRTSEESETANIHWEQRKDDSLLRLSGPLGSHATLIESDGKTMVIRRGEERSVRDLNSPDTESRSGWNLPLQALPHWLKGIPAPGMAVDVLQLEPNRELLQSLQQDGWQIRYERYEEFGDFTLPTRVTIERDATRARLLIRKWKTGL
jgi:outer membrane lipoprotein LolB